MDRSCAQFNLKAAQFRVCRHSSSSSIVLQSHAQARGEVEGEGFRLRRHQRAFRKFLSLSPLPHHHHHHHHLRSKCPAKFHHGHSFACPRVPSLVRAASASSNEYESRSVGTPLEPQTPEGNFLCGILKNHPHIFAVAASEQLIELATERDNALARWERSVGSSESCLHGRISAMKELECQIAIEEVMYLLVVHNFYEIKVPMIPTLSKCTNDGQLEIWTSKIQELESIHGLEIIEMVREHVSNVLRWKGTEAGSNWHILKIKRLQLGRVYAASVMYGYFLKSVSLRHHLELSLPSMHMPTSRFQKHQREENLVALRCYDEAASSLISSSSGGGERKPEKLRGYMMSFDSKALQLCAQLRSQEAANLIEKHTWALFGYPERNKDDDSEVIAVSASSLRRLVLEAVAFGSFLWEVERYVDSVYGLKEK